MITRRNFKLVYCDFINDVTYARELDGKWFCGCCGSTDHVEDESTK